MEPGPLTRLIRSKAEELGFDAVGIAPVTRLNEERLRRWLELDYHGKMGYMARNVERRVDPGRIVRDARSVISLALNYYHPYPLPYDDPGKAVISRYASGDDYHDVMWDRLSQLYGYIKEHCPRAKGRYYCDTGAVLDKAWAERSGIGWIGKHTNAIAKRRMGSWFFIGEILLDCELIYDQPAADHCGSCTRCIEICPTDAIVEPYILDSRRCISYLTIELREDIPVEFREPMENLIYGCDLCQDVCPWNRKAVSSGVAELAPREENRAPDLVELACLSREDFSRRFRKSPIKRTKWRGLMRNVAVAMGNSESAEMIPSLSGLLEADDSMVRRHAAWALGKIGTQESLDLVRQRLSREEDPDTRQALKQALSSDE